MKTLQELMKAQLPEGGVAVPYGRNLHMEVVEVATGRVWMSTDPVTPQDYDILLETLDESLRGVGVGVAAMDAALFRCSPGGESEPVRERDIGGRRYINVAVPGEPAVHPGGMMECKVNKAHVVGFEAGRTLVIMSSPDGDFVEVVGNAEQDETLSLPEGASLKTIILQAPWVVPLPTPTVAFFHFGPSGMRSFQGPVTLPQK
jgi:hypothetical protein